MGSSTTSPSVQQGPMIFPQHPNRTRGVLRIGFIKIRGFVGLQLGGPVKPAEKTSPQNRGPKTWLYPPGTPSVLCFEATLPLKPATFALKIGHLAFQAVVNGKRPKINGCHWGEKKKTLGPKIISLQLWLVGAPRDVMFRCPNQNDSKKLKCHSDPKRITSNFFISMNLGLWNKIVVCHPGPKDLPPVKNGSASNAWKRHLRLGSLQIQICCKTPSALEKRKKIFKYSSNVHGKLPFFFHRNLRISSTPPPNMPLNAPERNMYWPYLGDS